MTQKSNDALLRFGTALARLLQALCALAGGVVCLLILRAILVSQDMLPGLGGGNGGDIVDASPLSAIVLLVLMATGLAAMFLFFGRLRAIIATAQGGDPFIPENARRLEAMAWLVLAWEILNVAIGALRLHLANLASGGQDHLDWSLYDLDGLLIVLVLFILARIFGHGATMREDLEGTV